MVHLRQSPLIFRPEVTVPAICNTHRMTRQAAAMAVTTHLRDWILVRACMSKSGGWGYP